MNACFLTQCDRPKTQRWEWKPPFPTQVKKHDDPRIVVANLRSHSLLIFTSTGDMHPERPWEPISKHPLSSPAALATRTFQWEEFYRQAP